MITEVLMKSYRRGRLIARGIRQPEQIKVSLQFTVFPGRTMNGNKNPVKKNLSAR